MCSTLPFGKQTAIELGEELWRRANEGIKKKLND
jgi:hypothetical protein